MTFWLFVPVQQSSFGWSARSVHSEWGQSVLRTGYRLCSGKCAPCKKFKKIWLFWRQMWQCEESKFFVRNCVSLKKGGILLMVVNKINAIAMDLNHWHVHWCDLMGDNWLCNSKFLNHSSLRFALMKYIIQILVLQFTFISGGNSVSLA